jgi:hypothetical protein
MEPAWVMRETALPAIFAKENRVEMTGSSFFVDFGN